MDIVESTAQRVPDGERERNEPGNDIDQLPDESSVNVEHVVTGVLSTVGETYHDRVKVALWRLNNPRDLSDQEYLAEYLPQEFTLDRVSQDFGGGYYRAIVKVPRLDKISGVPVGNVLQIAKAPRFRIGGIKKDPTAQPVAAPGAQSADMSGAIKVMMDGMEKMMDRFAQLHQQPAPKTTLEMAQELNAIKNLFAPAPTPPAPDPLAQALQQFTLLEKMKSIFNPPSGAAIPENPSDNALLMNMAEKLLPLIVGAVQAKNGAAPAVPGTPEQEMLAPPEEKPETPAETPAESTPVDEEENPVDLMKQAQELMLKGYVKILVQNARANNDVEAIAQEVYEKATDEMWEFLQAPDWLDKLATYDAGVKLFPGWFERLRARLLEIDAEPVKSEPES